MNMAPTKSVLAQSIWQGKDATYLRQLALVAFGVLLLAVCAKISVPMWPVPITMGTFAVLGIGTVYGARLGLATIAAYLAVGAVGGNVFAGSSAQESGLAYMAGSTGGYLLGYVFATLIMGLLAGNGWDRTPLKMAGAMLIGNIAIYVPGLLWLGFLLGWDNPIFAWGLTPFIIGDLLKISLAALLVPAAWKRANNAKSQGQSNE
ncbi:MAG: biotin transporter BioY [Rhodobacteraceae bacterium]